MFFCNFETTAFGSSKDHCEFVDMGLLAREIAAEAIIVEVDVLRTMVRRIPSFTPFIGFGVS
jgi:hypothetical protein